MEEIMNQIQADLHESFGKWLNMAVKSYKFVGENWVEVIIPPYSTLTPGPREVGGAPILQLLARTWEEQLEWCCVYGKEPEYTELGWAVYRRCAQILDKYQVKGVDPVTNKRTVNFHIVIRTGSK